MLTEKHPGVKLSVVAHDGNQLENKADVCYLFRIFQGLDGYLPKNSTECESSGERFQAKRDFR